MNPQVPTNEAKTQARRRLLRGTFAAPAVLTICSGSTFAQAATSLTCVAKQVNTVKDTVGSETTTTASAGNWVRVPLQMLRDSLNVTVVDSVWISGAYISANIQKTGTSNTLVGSSSWLCYRKVATDSGYTQGNSIPAAPSRPGYALAPTGEWVAVLVDASGNINGVVGLQSPGPGQYPVHATSCWSSFRPGYVPWN